MGQTLFSHLNTDRQWLLQRLVYGTHLSAQPSKLTRDTSTMSSSLWHFCSFFSRWEAGAELRGNLEGEEESEKRAEDARKLLSGNESQGEKEEDEKKVWWLNFLSTFRRQTHIHSSESIRSRHEVYILSLKLNGGVSQSVSGGGIHTGIICAEGNWKCDPNDLSFPSRCMNLDSQSSLPSPHN